jgi:hypothetical protein
MRRAHLLAQALRRTRQFLVGRNDPTLRAHRLKSG